MNIVSEEVLVVRLMVELTRRMPPGEAKCPRERIEPNLANHERGGDLVYVMRNLSEVML